MRVFIVTVALLGLLATGAVAQQNSSNDEAKEKKTKSAEPGSKNSEKKPSQPAEKTETNPSSEEQKAAAPKPGTDKDKEESDVSQVPPLVTHHQITLDGKALKYTATPGRLPTKRADGKIEAEMFF